MRALGTIAVLIFGFAGVSAAAAADLGLGDGRIVSADYSITQRAGALVIYDYEPGIVQRAYWLPGWQGRHYFPFHAEKVRHTAPAGRPKPAESYFRYWSNDGAVLDQQPPAALQSFGATAAPRQHERKAVARPPSYDDDARKHREGQFSIE